MVQVCGGGVGEKDGGGWGVMEFYPWRGTGRGLTGPDWLTIESLIGGP